MPSDAEFYWNINVYIPLPIRQTFFDAVIEKWRNHKRNHLTHKALIIYYMEGQRKCSLPSEYRDILIGKCLFKTRASGKGEPLFLQGTSHYLIRFASGVGIVFITPSWTIISTDCISSKKTHLAMGRNFWIGSLNCRVSSFCHHNLLMWVLNWNKEPSLFLAPC